MELLDYLSQNFFTREQLLARSGIDAGQLATLQQDGVMPKPSYRLRLAINCDSFFGPCAQEASIDYYAKGYEAWISVLLSRQGEAKDTFTVRYRERLVQLAAQGIAPRGLLIGNDEHIDSEWRHFLDGTYGLCTVSGLPEDIAAKEAAIALIRELTAAEHLDTDDRDRLRRAVDLLYCVSAQFAPHEVARSSRRRYVDEVRIAFGLA